MGPSAVKAAGRGSMLDCLWPPPALLDTLLETWVLSKKEACCAALAASDDVPCS